MSRKPLVVGNWKLNHTRHAARTWCARFAELIEGSPLHKGVDAGVAPSFTSLEPVREMAHALGLLLGAQDMHWEPSGAFTGEVSGEMLREAGCSFVLVGHSERRQHFSETDERIARKVRASQDAGLIPVLCLGETENQRESGRMETIIENQLRRGLAHAVLNRGHDLIIAYEPVWAIGTGRVAGPEQAQEAHQFLRGVLGAIAGSELAGDVRILYGGSVTPANASSLARMADIDGFLVGGASLDPENFHRIIAAWTF